MKPNLKIFDITKATLEEHALVVGLSHVLSDFPDSWHPEKVLDMIGESDDVVVWEPLEYMSGDQVAYEARNIADSLLKFKAFYEQARFVTKGVETDTELPEELV